MSSIVQICNLALLKFGDITITALTDATKEARACNVLYPLMRDELTGSHPWNFAMKRADISAQVTTAPAFGYEYAYTLPADCLRVWELYGYTAEWEVENGQLLTDLDQEVYIRYIAQVTEAGKFPPSYVECLATKLGAELAARIAKDGDKRIALLEELEKVWLPRAYRLNAIEGNRTRHQDEKPLDENTFAWVTEGR